MRKRFLIPFLAGIGVVVILVAGVLYMQRGAVIEVKGGILKVRTLAMQDGGTVAVIDFRFVNPSNYPFIVQRVEISLEGADGQTVDGATVAEVDAKNLFQYFPALGQKYNPSLLARDKIPPHQSNDRMIAARFEIPEEKVASRRNLIIRITEVDGAESELHEKK